MSGRPGRLLSNCRQMRPQPSPRQPLPLAKVVKNSRRCPDSSSRRPLFTTFKQATTNDPTNTPPKANSSSARNTHRQHPRSTPNPRCPSTPAIPTFSTAPHPAPPPPDKKCMRADQPLNQGNMPRNFKYPENARLRGLRAIDIDEGYPLSVSLCSFKGVASLKRRRPTTCQQGTRHTVPLVTMSRMPPSDPKSQNCRP